MSFTHHALIHAAGGEEEARARFERMVGACVRLEYPTVRNLRSARGDWGIDAFVGELDDRVSVWQAKFFIGQIGDPQRRQIRESFGQLMKSASERGFVVTSWTLCIPILMAPEEANWFDAWRTKAGTAYPDVTITVPWDRDKLGSLLFSPSGVGVRAEFLEIRSGVPTHTAGSAPDRSAAMRASLGHLRLRAEGSEPCFWEHQGPVGYADVYPVGAVIGRTGGDADVEVIDESLCVSRRHVLIQPIGLQWYISDCGSQGGTTVSNPDGARLPLTEAPVPLRDGAVVALADRVRFCVERMITSAAGESTRGERASAEREIDYLVDTSLHRLADALLRPRREHPGSDLVVSASQLAEDLGWEIDAVQARLDELKAEISVARHLPHGRRLEMRQLADAVAQAFPYLAAPRG